MIHKSKSKPPQFGYIYLGRNFYLTVDPIGDCFLWSISWIYYKIIKKEFDKWRYWKLNKDDNIFPKIRPPHNYINEILRWWDNIWRVKLKIPYLFK